MASMEERDHEDQHVGHVAFRIPNFWPHDRNTWFRKIESKFRICNIRQSSTKYDHLLSALPTNICSSINDSLAEIDENTADAYEQLKALLMSRYTLDCCALPHRSNAQPAGPQLSGADGRSIPT